MLSPTVILFRSKRAIVGFSLVLCAASPLIAASAVADARPYPYGTVCGVERWSVKTLDDSSAAHLSRIPQPSSVDALVQTTVPMAAGRRRAPMETTLWRLKARLVGYRLEHDSDVHLVLASPQSGRTMIGEVPAPYCAIRYAAAFKRARRQVAMIGHHEPGLRWWWLDYRGATPPLVIVTGYGYIDYEHGQTGGADNGVELHPVLDVQLLHY